MLGSMLKRSKCKNWGQRPQFLFIGRVSLSCVVEPQWPFIAEINLLDYKHTKFSWLNPPQIKPEKVREKHNKYIYCYNFKFQSPLMLRVRNEYVCH